MIKEKSLTHANNMSGYWHTYTYTSIGNLV